MNHPNVAVTFDERVFVDNVVDAVSTRQPNPSIVANVVTTGERASVRTVDIVGMEDEAARLNHGVKSRDAIG